MDCNQQLSQINLTSQINTKRLLSKSDAYLKTGKTIKLKVNHILMLNVYVNVNVTVNVNVSSKCGCTCKCECQCKCKKCK